MSVTALKPNGMINKGSLAQLGNDPDLDSFMVVCHWKDGTSTVGWQGGIPSAQLIYGAAALSYQVNQQIFERPDDE